MHVGMYDCMRSESKSMFGNQLSGILESEFSNQCDNQLSGVLRKTTKQTCILVCLCMYACLRANSESASYSSPPQLKRVRVISAYARACSSTISLISLYCVCFVIPKNTHTHKKNNKNTGKYMSSNDGKSTLSLKHSISVLSHDNHTHSLKR